MNVSPHHQRPTKYPWPGPPSAVGVVVVIVAALILGFIVMTWVNDDDERDAARPSEIGRPTGAGASVLFPATALVHPAGR